MNYAERSERALVTRLDAAIDAYDLGADSSELELTLADIASLAAESDPPFSERVARVAARTALAADISHRDIASVLARDVRRDLMCWIARKSGGETAQCVPKLSNRLSRS